MQSKIHAHSMNNGILFYSNRHKGYVAVATIDESGIVKSEWTTIKEYEEKHQSSFEKTSKERALQFIFSYSFILTILIAWTMYITNPIYAVRELFIGYSLMHLVNFLITNRIEPEQQKRFHSAEHMAINAYEKIGKIPSIKEASSYSRFSNLCGTNISGQHIVSSTLMFVCSFITNLLYSIIAILLVYLIVPRLSKLGVLNFFQYFVTSPPTDKELRVTIEAMNVYFVHEM